MTSENPDTRDPQAKTPHPLEGVRPMNQAAKDANVPYTWLRAHVKAKNIPSVRIGANIMVSPKVVLDLLHKWVHETGEPDIKSSTPNEPDGPDDE